MLHKIINVYSKLFCTYTYWTLHFCMKVSSCCLITFLLNQLKFTIAITDFSYVCRCETDFVLKQHNFVFWWVLFFNLKLNHSILQLKRRKKQLMCWLQITKSGKNLPITKKDFSFEHFSGFCIIVQV